MFRCIASFFKREGTKKCGPPKRFIQTYVTRYSAPPESTRPSARTNKHSQKEDKSKSSPCLG